MSKIKYRIKEYEEYVHEYKRNENSKLIMEIADVRKVYHPQIYRGWWSGWVNLSDYPYYSEAEALNKIENHKKAMSVVLDNKVRYINID
jgi:hypothetical protein